MVSRDVVGAPDAIVVLASHEWERLPAAAKLAHAFPASLVLLTVPREVSPWNCHLCSERAAWLQNAGIAAERIVELPDRVSNTRDEAIATRQFAGTRPIGAVVVVTSPYHTRRALHVFEEAMRGAEVAVGVMPATASSPADPAGWWWHPYDRWYVTYEWSALLYYRIRFGVPTT